MLRAACPASSRDYIGMISPPPPARIVMRQIMRASASVSGTQLVGRTGNRPTNVPLRQQDTKGLILLLCEISNLNLVLQTFLVLFKQPYVTRSLCRIAC